VAVVVAAAAAVAVEYLRVVNGPTVNIAD